MNAGENVITLMSRISLICLLCLLFPFPQFGRPVQDNPLTPEQVIDNIRTQSFTGKKIDFVFSNADIGDMVDFLEAVGGIRFDLNPRIKIKATYHMLQVPWDQALAAILADHELHIDLAQNSMKIYRGQKYVLAFNDGKKVKTFMFLYERFYLILIALFVLIAGTVGIVLIKKSKAKRNQNQRKDLLGREQAEEIEKKLVFLLEVKKIYRDDKLTLLSLSEILGITLHQLSWVINNRLNKSFPSLINHYRVEEVKTKLAGTGRNETTILHSAFESGFSTKASFNKAFKAITGLTPSQYRNKHFREDSFSSTSK